MSDWYDYLTKKMDPKPAYERPMPRREERDEPIEVTEGEASDSMVLRVIKFWQR